MIIAPEILRLGADEPGARLVLRGRSLALRFEGAAGRVVLVRRALLPPWGRRRVVPFAQINALKLEVGAEGGEPLLLTLRVRSDRGRRGGDTLAVRFAVDALDRRDEALDLAFRIAHVLRFRGCLLRRVAPTRLELELLRVAPEAAHPFRALAPGEYEVPLERWVRAPIAASAADYHARRAEVRPESPAPLAPTTSAPEVSAAPPPPRPSTQGPSARGATLGSRDAPVASAAVVPAPSRYPGYEVLQWSPGQRLRVRGRALYSLEERLVGIAAMLVVVGALGAGIAGALWALDPGPHPYRWWLAVVSLVLAVVEIPMIGLVLRSERPGLRHAVLDWDRRVVHVHDAEGKRDVAFDAVDSVTHGSRGLAPGVHTHELVVGLPGPDLVLLGAIAPSSGTGVDQDFEAMARELAAALQVPLRRRDAA